MNIACNLKLKAVHDQIKRFRPLFWQGVKIDVLMNVSLRQILEHELSVDIDIIENRIRTVFLDGRPVDDLSAAIVRDGSRIALGAALPGVVGIAMQRQTPVAFLRAELTSPHVPSTETPQPGRITIRLFNQIAEILTPALLRRTVFIDAAPLKTVIADLPRSLPIECNGQTITAAELARRLADRDASIPALVSLQVLPQR